VGVIMFLLASLTPFLLLKLLPVVEAAVVAQGISRGPARSAQSAVITTAWVARLAGTGAGALAGGAASSAPAGRAAIGPGTTPAKPPSTNDPSAQPGNDPQKDVARRSSPRDLAKSPSTTTPVAPRREIGDGPDLAGHDPDQPPAAGSS
jgi:hypothetical protein